MEGEKTKKQDRKTKQRAVANKPVQEPRHNENAMMQAMQSIFQKNPQQDSFNIAKQMLDVADKADLPVCLVHAILHGNDEIAEYLIQKEAAKSSPPTVLQSKWFSLFPGHNEELIKSYRKTPYLILAAQYGRIKVFRRLVRQSTNVNETGFAGVYKTNLIITNVIGAAVFNNQTEIVKFLLDEYDGSDLGIEFKTQEEKASQNLPSFIRHLTGCTPLLLALHKNCDTKIVECLIQEKANILAKDLNNNSALHIAVINNNVEHAQLLLAKEIPLVDRNNKGETAESIARSKNLTEIIKLFQTQGDNSQKMAELLIQQEELIQQKKMKKKKKKQEVKKVEEVNEESKVKEPASITIPPKQSTQNIETSSENKDQDLPSEEQQLQQVQELLETEQTQQTEEQTQEPVNLQEEKEQPQSEQQSQVEKPQQLQVQKEEDSNTLEQFKEDPNEIADKNMKVVGMNPELLKQKKQKKDKKNEQKQNFQKVEIKQDIKKQDSSQQQPSTQQSKKQQNDLPENSGYQEKQKIQPQKQVNSKEQAKIEAAQVQKLEAEILDLQKKFQNMTRRMLTLEKDLSNEKKKRQECENLLQSKLETSNKDQDKRELLDMCNEQLRAKAVEISKLKKMLSGK